MTVQEENQITFLTVLFLRNLDHFNQNCFEKKLTNYGSKKIQTYSAMSRRTLLA